MVRPIPECGTLAGYHRHIRLKEEVDEACRKARRKYLKRWRDNAPAPQHVKVRAAMRLARLRPVEYQRLLIEELKVEARKRKDREGQK